MTNGLSQASMAFESFPDKPHMITELSAVQTYDWQAYQSGWRGKDSRTIAFV